MIITPQNRYFFLPTARGLMAFLARLSKLLDNLVENSIHPLALGREDYMFAGSHRGAQRAAMFYSFFGPYQRLGINPYTWLKDVLDRIPEHKAKKLHKLLPHNWINTKV